MLISEDFRLQDGFKFAYLNLLKYIANNDLTAIGECCERNLYRAFADGLNDLNREVDKVELLNEEKYPKNIDMEVVDFH